MSLWRVKPSNCANRHGTLAENLRYTGDYKGSRDLLALTWQTHKFAVGIILPYDGCA